MRTQYQKAPYKIETGTLNHAALAGVSACIRFIASTFGYEEDASIHTAMETLSKHEYLLLEQLYNGIKKLPNATRYGPALDSPRTPTVSFTFEGLNPIEVCTILGKKGIYAWDGHFYAIRPIEATSQNSSHPDLSAKNPLVRMLGFIPANAVLIKMRFLEKSVRLSFESEDCLILTGGDD